MVDAHGGKGSLELGMGIESVGGRAVTEEREAVGVEAGRQAIFFEQEPKMAEVAPSGIAGDEGSTQDFSGVIVEGQNESGV